jgi:hypothetical protein
MKKLLIIILLISLSFALMASENDFRRNVLLDNNLRNVKFFKSAIALNIIGSSMVLIGLPMLAVGSYYMDKTPVDYMKLIFAIGCTAFITGILLDLVSVIYFVASGKPLREFKKKMKRKLQLKKQKGPNIKFGVRFDYE